MDKNQILKFALLGKSLSHSLSPFIHNSLFGKQQIAADYQLLELDEEAVKGLLQIINEQKYNGLNVTIPYKETVMPMLDGLDESVNAIGAVNTIALREGRLWGYNTDYLGIIAMFQQAGISLPNKNVVVLGSGGAAKALLYACRLQKVASVTVAARNRQAVTVLQEQFPEIKTCSWLQPIAGDIVVNTTPLGMYPNIGETPMRAEYLQHYQIAVDLIYNPLATLFLQTAKQYGLQTVSGLSMLVEQAIAAQKIWFGEKFVEPSSEGIMLELERQLQSKN